MEHQQLVWFLVFPDKGGGSLYCVKKGGFPTSRTDAECTRVPFVKHLVCSVGSC